MGVGNSVELCKQFQDIAKWPKTRVESVIKAYNEGEYDFGIDYTVVMKITGYEPDDAKELVKVHSKNDSGIINAITLLITIISLGNGENRNEIGRLESIFDLMDFSHNSQVSMDEMTILLLCVGSSFAFITNRSAEEQPVDTAIIQYGKHVYESLGKKPTNYITKDEFCEWVKENVFARGLTIADILQTIITSPETQSEQADAAAGGADGSGVSIKVDPAAA